MSRFKFWVAIIAMAIPLQIGVRGAIAWGLTEEVSIKVAEKERVVAADGQSAKYLIFGEGEVFEDTDTWWYLKFNSADVYAQMKRGQTYKVKVTGIRVPLLSWNRNIIRILGEG